MPTFQTLEIGEYTWNAVISVLPDRIHDLLNESKRVFVLSNVEWDPQTCEAKVKLVPGNGMMTAPNVSLDSSR